MTQSSPSVLISYARESPTVPPSFSTMLTQLTDRAVEVFAAQGAQVQLFDAVAAPHASADDQWAADALRDADALVVMGGADVDPTFYGQDAHPTVDGTNTSVDAAEIALIREAARSGVPVFGICRGLQVINVALGGTLVQHLGDRTEHRHPTNSERFTDHVVELSPDSGLATASAALQVNVQSAHHQAVDAVAPILRAVAWTADGVVEALESSAVSEPTADDPWVLGVQWHPEAPDAEAGPFTDLAALVLNAAQSRRANESTAIEA